MVLQMRKWKVMRQPKDWYWYDVGRHFCQQRSGTHGKLPV